MEPLSLILLIGGLISIACSCMMIHHVFLKGHSTQEIVIAFIGAIVGALCLLGALSLQTTSENTQYYTKTDQYKLADITLVKKATDEKNNH